MRGNLWAVTTYYNPAGYRLRLKNYRVFRAHLGVPLLTVELSVSGHYELEETDADVLIRIPATSVLWQKERLLNVGLDHLPQEAKFIAWVDCDVIFDEQGWFKQIPLVLSDYPVAQLYSEIVDLMKDGSSASASGLIGHSVVCTERLCPKAPDNFGLPGAKRTRRGAFGGAWAGRRELLQEHGFYDAMIVGGGDRAFACACYGHFQDAITSSRMSKSRADHYLRWATPVYEAIAARVGLVEGRLLHLWHGNLKDRRYIERHDDLSTFEFNPSSDLRKNKAGAWEWTHTSDRSLQDMVKQYFELRNEDGPAPLDQAPRLGGPPSSE